MPDSSTPATATAPVTAPATAPVTANTSTITNIQEEDSSKKKPGTSTSTSTSAITSSRRSSRRSTSQLQDPVIAPGFGTAKDLQRLARDLSAGTGSSLPVEAVQAMMESRGSGIRSSRRSEDAAASASAASATTPVSTAWSDFMKEEGVSAPAAKTATATAAAAAAATDEPSTETGKRDRDGDANADANADGEKTAASTTATTTDTATATATTTTSTAATDESRVYNLDSLQPTKKTKSEVIAGVLVQTGTLDSAIVGRSKKFDLEEAHCLTVPTKILPGVQIKSVFAAGHACHSIAISTDGTCYGWGRNESQQLGSLLPVNIYQPTILEQLPGRVAFAALGKSHTLLLMESGDVYAVGSNKVGQCGIKSSTELVPNFRKCVFPEDTTIVQVACGEQFSVALCDSGYIYTTGSAEFGQLGNGETGEHFVAANKIAFANESAWTQRTTFCHSPNEKLHSSSDKTAKVAPLVEDIRIQQIACGKHHAIALEVNSDDTGRTPRVFTWGCGDYGILGHGVQADEYFPRCVGTLANLTLPATGSSHLSISAGQNCSLLQTANGHIYYWGKHRSVGEATMRPTLIDALANNGHIVTQAAAGGQTVVCSTLNAQTVAWGQGPHGELGLGTKQKSSAKPAFVPGIDSCRIAAIAAGYGHTIFIVRDDDAEDKAAVKKLPVLDPEATQSLADKAAAAPPPAAKKPPGKKASKKK